MIGTRLLQLLARHQPAVDVLPCPPRRDALAQALSLPRVLRARSESLVHRSAHGRLDAVSADEEIAGRGGTVCKAEFDVRLRCVGVRREALAEMCPVMRWKMAYERGEKLSAVV